MSLQPFTKITLVETITLDKNAVKVIDLTDKFGRDLYITRLNLLFKLNVTGGTSPAPATYAPYTFIKNLRVVVAPANIAVWNLTGPLCYIKQYYEHKGLFRKDSLPGAGKTADVYFEVIVHFGLNPRDPKDLSAAVPTSWRGRVESAKLEIYTGTDSDLGADLTINSAEVKITAYVAKIAGVARKPKYLPSIFGEIDKETWTAARPLENPVEVDIPKTLVHKAFLHVKDSGGAPADLLDLIVYGMQVGTEFHELLKIDALQEKEDDKRRYETSPLTGVYVFDAGERGVEVIDARGKQLKLKLTTTAAGSLDALWVAYKPYW